MDNFQPGVVRGVERQGRETREGKGVQPENGKRDKEVTVSSLTEVYVRKCPCKHQPKQTRREALGSYIHVPPIRPW